MEKRGQGLSTSSIILIVLGVIVLAVLAFGFILGWESVLPWVNTGEDNIDQIAQACQVACTTQSQYEFCSTNRTLIVEGKEVARDTTCDGLAKSKPEYGIEDCSLITCS